MQSRHKELLDEFSLCIDEKRYYDAHEALEKLWYPRRFEEDNEVKLLKGFINGAVSLELYKRGKITQSKNVHKTYLNLIYLKFYRFL